MIIIIDYGMGNCESVKKMIEYVGGEARISSDKDEIKKATKLIMPGVGSFDQGMENLEKQGLIELIKQKVIKDKIPILGICLGMQLLSKKSEEGERAGLGLINSEVVKFEFENKKTKVPHMGWNYVKEIKKSKLTKNLPENPRFYFVHSYYMKCKDKTDILLTTEYEITFVSAVEKNNIMGTQFHPEKSHKFGMKIIENFVKNV